MPSLLNTIEDHAYYQGLEIKQLQDQLALEKVKVETLAARNENLEDRNERLRDFEQLVIHYQERLRKIAKHPDTPELIRQYARGEI